MGPHVEPGPFRGPFTINAFRCAAQGGAGLRPSPLDPPFTSGLRPEVKVLGGRPLWPAPPLPCGSGPPIIHLPPLLIADVKPRAAVKRGPEGPGAPLAGCFLSRFFTKTLASSQYPGKYY